MARTVANMTELTVMKVLRFFRQRFRQASLTSIFIAMYFCVYMFCRIVMTQVASWAYLADVCQVLYGKIIPVQVDAKFGILGCHDGFLPPSPFRDHFHTGGEGPSAQGLDLPE